MSGGHRNIDRLTLEVFCWCGKHIYRIPRGQVAAGETASCGPGCRRGVPVKFAPLPADPYDQAS